MSSSQCDLDKNCPEGPPNHLSSLYTRREPATQPLATNTSCKMSVGCKVYISVYLLACYETLGEFLTVAVPVSSFVTSITYLLKLFNENAHEMLRNLPTT